MISRQEVIELLGSDWTTLQERIRGALASDIRLLDDINGSILSTTGKQLRPMLGLLVAGALGTVNSDSISYAAAGELLHNATLLHDDVVDQSATRRGKPTVSALMGPGTAVLAGDFWLSRTVGTIVGTTHQDQVIPFFAKTLSDLSEGELLQMEKSSTADTTEEDYCRIVYCKTASLFETVCLAAAVSVDASPELRAAAARYGAATGMAFQIRDDIFDYGDPTQIGKPTGSDLRERKITLPLLGVLRNSPDEAFIRSLVADIPSNPSNADRVRSFVLDGGGIEYASLRLDGHISEALEALEAFPPSERKDLLAALARFNAVRQS